MFDAGFRDRVYAAAERIEARTGVDPLDLRQSMAATTDDRLEMLPRSIGIGLGAMAFAVAIASFGFLLDPVTGPGYAGTTVFVLVGAVLAVGSAASVVVARAARSRRPQRDRYEDAWARLAVEVWPAPRYQLFDGVRSAGSGYSRTEFLLALRDDDRLDRFRLRAPFTAMP